MQLETFDSAAFLRDYWQKQPLLIRNPWAAWRNPLEPDELAGLACEPEVEARLVSVSDAGRALDDGPSLASRLGAMGERDWTLLVQAVDHHVPEVAALVEAFRFVPNWRIDDVMASYAADGGGVGAHFDQYDVFLVQGLGRRRWQVGQRCDADTAMLPHDDLRLVADFEATAEWVLEPGDILYVPPGIAHHGVALGGDCMTYSIGFRAPSRGELVAHWCDHVLDGLTDDDRYADPDLQVQANPGEIAPEAVARLHAMVTEALGDSAGFARWAGEFVTLPKYPEVDWRPDETLDVADVRALVERGVALSRNPASRFSFIRHGSENVVLFVNGESFDCAGETARLAMGLCAQDRFAIDPALVQGDGVPALVTALVNSGSIAFDDTDGSET